MDIKLKRSDREPLYIISFVVCMCAFLTCIVSITAAATLNGYAWYMEADPYVIQENGQYNSILEYFQENYESFPKIWLVIESHMKIWLILAIASGFVALIALIYLVVTVGKRDEAGQIIMSRFDRIFSELQLAAILAIFFLGGAAFTTMARDTIECVYEMSGGISAFSIVMDATFGIVIGFGSAAMGLALILSGVKKIKAGKFIAHSLCGMIFSGMYRDVYKSGGAIRRVMLLMILTCVLSATVFLAPVVLIMILLFIPKWMRKYEEIRNGLEEVSNGNLDYKIPMQGDDELDHLAGEINKITEATSAAVQNELKVQRMKTDLISNVSHDLKTPLTSMVTYIDLLKTEGLDSPNASQYLDILQQKTERLRQLTEDLFEAAKASSGATPVRMSRVDLLSLVNQGLGELNEYVEESCLEFVVSASKERYFVKADGQHLWRVISNLLGNVLKYSQSGTRVYITFAHQQADGGNLVVLEIKNISKQSLNIDPAELMERFKRGDESRATEGSGLGLAIAKDLMKLMGGWLDIAIDGDLFKAKIMLHAASEDDPIVADMEDIGDMSFRDSMDDLGQQKDSDDITDLNHADSLTFIDEMKTGIDETIPSADISSRNVLSGIEQTQTSASAVASSAVSAVSQGNLQRLRQAGRHSTESM